VTLKAFLAATIGAALIAGICLPAMLRQDEPKSQIDQIDVARR
jgi:hypothetical protein